MRALAPTVSRPAQRGLTLVELMISMLLGLFLIFAATTLFEITKRTTLAQEANARLMENGRAATEILNRSVRMARYFGCAGVAANQVRNHFDTSNANQANLLMNGYDQQGIFGEEGASGSSGEPDEPDEIIIFRVLDDEAEKKLPALVNLGTDPVKLTPAADNPEAGDMIVVNDCLQADIFNTTSKSFNSGTGHDEYLFANCPTCTQSYLSGATVLPVVQEHFYIKEGTSCVNVLNSGTPRCANSLFVADPNDPSTERELIDGVANMQILYGVDTDADGVANQYVKPEVIFDDCDGNDNATCWRRVATVRIALLLETVNDHVTTKPQDYRFDDEDYSTNDRRLRREFLSIIALRNYRP